MLTTLFPSNSNKRSVSRPPPSFRLSTATASSIYCRHRKGLPSLPLLPSPPRPVFWPWHHESRPTSSSDSDGDGDSDIYPRLNLCIRRPSLPWHRIASFCIAYSLTLQGCQQSNHPITTPYLRSLRRHGCLPCRTSRPTTAKHRRLAARLPFGLSVAIQPKPSRPRYCTRIASFQLSPSTTAQTTIQVVHVLISSNPSFPTPYSIPAVQQFEQTSWHRIEPLRSMP